MNPLEEEKVNWFFDESRKDMSRIKVTKKPSSKKTEKREDWPIVVYVWAVGLGLVGYLFVGEIALASEPHPIHWLAGLIGGLIGIGIGWLWYHWRGDVF